MRHDRSTLRDYDIADLMTAWHAAAVDLFKSDVRDFHRGQKATPEKIARIFAAVGWGFWIPDGYTERGGRNAWCGHTQGYCGLRVGDYLEGDRCVGISLNPEIARWVTPSTARLNSQRRWKQAGEDKPPHWRAEMDTLEDLENMWRGHPELATVAARDYGDARNQYGGHIVLISEIDWDAGEFYTIEGNAVGMFPDGTRGEGVVRCTRPLGDLARVYFLTTDDFELMEVG